MRTRHFFSFNLFAGCARVRLAQVVCAALVASTSAQAQLLGQVADVNAAATNSQTDENTVIGTTPGGLGFSTGETTVETAPLRLTRNRVYSGDGQFVLPVNFEFNVSDKLGFATISGDAVHDIRVGLRGGAFWREARSAPELIRPGSDQLFSEAAEGFNGALLDPSENTYRLFLTAEEGSEVALGFFLPLRLDSCADTSIEMLITSSVGEIRSTRSVANAGIDPVIALTECPQRDSITSTLSLFDVEVDVGDSTDFFTHFLPIATPAGDAADKGRTPVTNVKIGMVTLLIHNDVFDPMVAATNSSNARLRLVDISDISTFELAFQFADASALSLSLVDMDDNDCASFSPRTDDPTVLEIVLDQVGITNCFSFPSDAPTESGQQLGSAYIRITSNGATAIPQQKVELVRYRALLDNSQVNTVVPAAYTSEISFLGQTANQNLVAEDILRIVRNGINFGPFDWSTGPDRTVSSIFRFTGFPQDPDSPTDDEFITGFIVFEHSEFGEDTGRCSFNLAEMGMSAGETVINAGELASIIRDAETCWKEDRNGIRQYGAFDGDAFRADLTWSFFCPLDKCSDADVDRLLRADNGTLADYGDNGNDQNSFKARSCDPGRFGQHVFGALTSESADALAALCQPPD